MAAGSGWTAASDLSIAKIAVGATPTGPYASAPTNNWVGCFTNNFTASTKSPTTGVEWLVSSDTAYARQAMGASGAGWTIPAYVNGTGVVFSNSGTITQPAVLGTAQTLGAIGIWDSVGPTGGNALFFIDLATPQSVGIGVQVILASNSPGPAGMTFTMY